MDKNLNDAFRPDAVVPHPERVEADVIVRIMPSEKDGAAAYIDPAGGRPETRQALPPEVLEQIEGCYGYFRARWDGCQWHIGDALPREEWPEE